jgi:butyrate kinase
MFRKLAGEGGLVAHLGTNSAVEVEGRIRHGDAHARLVYKAMAYQIAKEIGAMATVLKGAVDAVVITGGVAHSEMLISWIRERVEWIAPFLVYPGEDEMLAMAQGVLRVLRGEEEARIY